MQAKQKRDQKEFSHSHILDALQICVVSSSAHCLCYCPSCLQSSCHLSQLLCITSSHSDHPTTTESVAWRALAAWHSLSHTTQRRHSTCRMWRKSLRVEAQQCECLCHSKVIMVIDKAELRERQDRAKRVLRDLDEHFVLDLLDLLRECLALREPKREEA